MTGHARNLMTANAFYAWLADQEDGKFELVGGEPRMLAGANRRHDRIAVNALGLLGNALVGHSCQPFTSNIHIRIPNGNLRHADVGVECGRPPDDSMEADCPFLVMEILSISFWSTQIIRRCVSIVAIVLARGQASASKVWKL